MLSNVKVKVKSHMDPSLSLSFSFSSCSGHCFSILRPKTVELNKVTKANVLKAVKHLKPWMMNHAMAGCMSYQRFGWRKSQKVKVFRAAFRENSAQTVQGKGMLDFTIFQSKNSGTFNKPCCAITHLHSLWIRKGFAHTVAQKCNYAHWLSF